MNYVHHILPTTVHYACMVDILRTSGHLEATTNLLQKLPDPSLSSWMVILSVCRHHGNIDVAKEAIEFIIKLEPQKETADSFVGFFLEVGLIILLIWRMIWLHCTFFAYKYWLGVFSYLSLPRKIG